MDGPRAIVQFFDLRRCLCSRHGHSVCKQSRKTQEQTPLRGFLLIQRNPYLRDFIAATAMMIFALIPHSKIHPLLHQQPTNFFFGFFKLFYHCTRAQLRHSASLLSYLCAFSGHSPASCVYHTRFSIVIIIFPRACPSPRYRSASAASLNGYRLSITGTTLPASSSSLRITKSF